MSRNRLESNYSTVSAKKHPVSHGAYENIPATGYADAHMEAPGIGEAKAGAQVHDQPGMHSQERGRGSHNHHILLSKMKFCHNNRPQYIVVIMLLATLE